MEAMIFMRLSLLSVAFLSSLAAFAAPADRVLIRDATIVDVRGERLLPHHDLLVTNGRIVEIRETTKDDLAALKLRYDLKTVHDAAGYYVTPGLIDSHIHLDLYAWEKQADDWSLGMYLANGVTTVRDCAGSSITMATRKAIESGRIYGPRMFVSSPFITSKAVTPGSNIYQVVDPADARARVNSFVDQGFFGIKVEAGLGKGPNYLAAAEAAEKRRNFLFGHTLGGMDNGYGEIYLSETLDHFRTLEHFGHAVFDFMQSVSSPYYRNPKRGPGSIGWFAGAYMDHSKTGALIELLRKKGGILSPTMVTFEYDLRLDHDKARFLAMPREEFKNDPAGQYLPDYYYDTWTYMYKNWTGDPNSPGRIEQKKGLENSRRLLKRLDDAGIPIIASTDVPARPYLMAGVSVHEEMDFFRRSGFSPWRALRTATLTPAMALGQKGKLGEVRAGAFADLIFTRENPIRRLEALKKPLAVMTRGVLLTDKKLSAMLDKQKEIVRKIPTPSIRFRDIHVDRPGEIHRH